MGTRHSSATSHQIAAALAQPPGPPGAEAAPNRPGFYAWWVDTDRLADADPPIPRVDHGVTGWSLLYVGIAPYRETSGRTVQTRIYRDHEGGTIGNSTFRQSLGVLLRRRLGLSPRPGYDRSRITNEGPLDEWISANCGLTVATVDHPWLYEAAVIGQLTPPLNIRPGVHPFRLVVGAARKAFRRECGVIR